jgi:hypothetical protein
MPRLQISAFARNRIIFVILFTAAAAAIPLYFHLWLYALIAASVSAVFWSMVAIRHWTATTTSRWGPPVELLFYWVCIAGLGASIWQSHGQGHAANFTAFLWFGIAGGVFWTLSAVWKALRPRLPIKSAD